MSLRIVPADNHASTFSHIGPREKGAPSAPGLHDTLRAGLGPSKTELDVPASAHPLEARLKAWEATQLNLRMEMLRRTYGIAEPVRRGMELKIVRDGHWRPAELGGNGGGAAPGNLHEEILLGRDDTITWEDVYPGDETREVLSMHEEMERKVKM